MRCIRAVSAVVVLLFGLVVHADLAVISWNAKHLGRKSFNTEESAKILTSFDIIAIQEVNTSYSGEKALRALATEISNQVGDDLCIGLSPVPTGEKKERYGYIWKKSEVTYVDKYGKSKYKCSLSTALNVPLDSYSQSKIRREPAVARFKDRNSGLNFYYASVHLRPTGKGPEKEVAPLFRGLDKYEYPVIVGGDFNLDPYDAAFETAEELGFSRGFKWAAKTSLKMKKRALNHPYDHFWIRGVKRVWTEVLNLYEFFDHLSIKEIYYPISDHSPIRMKFRF